MVALSGIFLVTTAFAPIVTLLPIITLPTITTPALIKQLSPMIGALPYLHLHQL